MLGFFISTLQLCAFPIKEFPRCHGSLLGAQFCAGNLSKISWFSQTFPAQNSVPEYNWHQISYTRITCTMCILQFMAVMKCHHFSSFHFNYSGSKFFTIKIYWFVFFLRLGWLSTSHLLAWWAWVIFYPQFTIYLSFVCACTCLLITLMTQLLPVSDSSIYNVIVCDRCYKF